MKAPIAKVVDFPQFIRVFEVFRTSTMYTHEKKTLSYLISLKRYFNEVFGFALRIAPLLQCNQCKGSKKCKQSKVGVGKVAKFKDFHSK